MGKPLRFCRAGHAYTPENTYIDRHGYQACQTCRPYRACSGCSKPIAQRNTTGRCKSCDTLFRRTAEGRRQGMAVRNRAPRPRDYGMEPGYSDLIKANAAFVASVRRCLGVVA